MLVVPSRGLVFVASWNEAPNALEIDDGRDYAREDHAIAGGDYFVGRDWSDAAPVALDLKLDRAIRSWGGVERLSDEVSLRPLPSRSHQQEQTVDLHRAGAGLDAPNR